MSNYAALYRSVGLLEAGVGNQEGVAPAHLDFLFAGLALLNTPGTFGYSRIDGFS